MELVFMSALQVRSLWLNQETSESIFVLEESHLKL